MPMARKHEEVGSIGIIGAGPGRPSTKIQTTHWRLLETWELKFPTLCFLPYKCQDSTADCEGPGKGGDGKDGVDVEPGPGKGQGGYGHQTGHHCPAFQHTHPPCLSFVVFIFQLYSPGVRVGEGIFHWPENEGSIVHQESCQRSRNCEEKIPTRVRTLALQKNLVEGKDAGLKFFLVNCSWLLETFSKRFLENVGFIWMWLGGFLVWKEGKCLAWRRSHVYWVNLAGPHLTDLIQHQMLTRERQMISQKVRLGLYIRQPRTPLYSLTSTHIGNSGCILKLQKGQYS